ncbi:MAG: DUF3307 domain-containing protein [Verrucomicrobia bacterium]|nr:DUF3307 domain-containing protein [Verrucomicrobiota bacterium]
MNGFVQQGPLVLFAAFAVLHFVADFPLQGEYLARNKVRCHAASASEWIVALCAHSAIQAGGVWLVTGSPDFAAVEFGLHALIDLAKGERKFGLLADQIMHLACKAGYVAVLACS